MKMKSFFAALLIAAFIQPSAAAPVVKKVKGLDEVKIQFGYRITRHCKIEVADCSAVNLGSTEWKFAKEAETLKKTSFKRGAQAQCIDSEKGVLSDLEDQPKVPVLIYRNKEGYGIFQKSFTCKWPAKFNVREKASYSFRIHVEPKDEKKKK